MWTVHPMPQMFIFKLVIAILKKEALLLLSFAVSQKCELQLFPQKATILCDTLYLCNIFIM
jgi:hypothetical protein